jgi:hypothetical protein
MKPWLKLALATSVLSLTLALSSTPAAALPSRCDQRCFFPDTCYDECQHQVTLAWTTCFDYFGGSCDPW